MAVVNESLLYVVALRRNSDIKWGRGEKNQFRRYAPGHVLDGIPVVDDLPFAFNQTSGTKFA